MKKSVLILGNNPVADMAVKQLDETQHYNVTQIKQGDFTASATYLNLDPETSIIVSFIGPQDVDLAIQELFDVVRRQHIKIEHFIMLSTAGIDNEVVGKLNYPGVKDVTEYLREQRYAIKIIDEAEIPYTVFRLVNLVFKKAGAGYTINEGKPVPAGNVSYETVAAFVVQAVTQNKFINQSVALLEDS